MGRFEGKSDVITGGTAGIGLATAERIVAEGGKVLITGLNAERLASASAMEGIHALRNDASAPEDAEALAAETKRLFGQVDGVFLNAGAFVPAALGEVTQERYRQQYDLNVGGVLFGAQALAPLIRSGGAMLIMASGSKTKGGPSTLLYAGTKGAVRSMALVLARQLLRQGIRVNTISPGPIATALQDPVTTGRSAAEIDALLKKIIPMGRMGSVAEAAAVATFLLSHESGFITGADYAVDGGEAQL
jgi:NAD(P)-dependent dehydrogenase (short-subunit alcohol dehydrogenase family)